LVSHIRELWLYTRTGFSFFAFENHGYESKNHPDNRQASIAVSDNHPTMGHFLFELLLLGKEWQVLLQSLFSCK
jgi:hypothetical protein